jgi:type I restriction enzyme S subunit
MMKNKMNQIILSIKPHFSNEIYNGNKPLELRKRIGKNFITNNKIYIYSSSPEKKITGHAEIKKIDKMTTLQIKHNFIELACITKKDFDEYYNCHEYGFVIWLKNIVKYQKPLALNDLKKVGFTPPQSFCYVNEQTEKLLKGVL